MVLAKILGCQVLLANCWSCSFSPICFPMSCRQGKYNNKFIAKLMLMWRREEMREMIAWLSCKHQAGHGCGGPK